MSYIKDFQKQINAQNYTGILQLWEEYCSGDEIDPIELKEILESIKNSKFADSFGKHVDAIIPLWEQIQDHRISCDIIRIVIDTQTSNSDKLRDITFNYLTKNYGSDPHFDLKMRLIGLQKTGPFQGSISNFELLNHINVGKFVFHTAGWGIGEIIEFSIVREQLTMEFDYAPGKKDLSFELAFKTLIPVSDDHFLAKRFGNPDSFEKEAKEDPAEAVKCLLRDLGPKTAAEIKDELCELVIPADEWTKWWQSARSKLKKDTMVEIPGDLKEPFKIRQKEVSHEERLKKALESKPDADTFIQMIYTFLKDYPETLKNIEFKKNLIGKFTEILAIKEVSKSQALQIYFLLEDLSSDIAKNHIGSIISETNPELMMKEIHILSFKKRFLIEIKNHLKNWKQIYLNLLFVVDYTPLRDFILTTLQKEKGDDELLLKLKSLIATPHNHPEMYFWYFQKIMNNDGEFPYSDNKGKVLLFESFLILLSHIENNDQYKELTKKIYLVLTQERYALVRKIFQMSSLEEVKEFLLLASKCNSLTSHDLKIFRSLAQVVHPSLESSSKTQEHEDVHHDQTIWCTQNGYHRAKTRLEEIATKETVDNAKEIEIARAHGDLRENSEFKSALERRDRLQAEMKFLSDQIGHARIITEADIPTNKVGIGTVIECVTDKGESISYTLLGPWEAEVEKNILSYQSKLAQKMKDLSIGDHFEFQNKMYTIKKIKSFL